MALRAAKGIWMAAAATAGVAAIALGASAGSPAGTESASCPISAAVVHRALLQDVPKSQSRIGMSVGTICWFWKWAGKNLSPDHPFVAYRDPQVVVQRFPLPGGKARTLRAARSLIDTSAMGGPNGDPNLDIEVESRPQWGSDAFLEIDTMRKPGVLGVALRGIWIWLPRYTISISFPTANRKLAARSNAIAEMLAAYALKHG